MSWARGAVSGLTAMLVLIGVVVGARAEHFVPDMVMSQILQLAGAAGVLSSRSCRDAESADQAADVLSHLLHHLRQSKYFGQHGQRQFRQRVVIPRIQDQRTLTHSSRDCVEARAIAEEADRTWRSRQGAAEVSGVFSLGDWGSDQNELNQVPALRPPATAHGRR